MACASETHAKKAKILIVDDHPLVREGLVARISAQTDLEVCGEAADVDDALALVESKHPELVIVDLTLRSSNGLAFIKKVNHDDPTTKMLVVSAHDESLLAERALRAGAHGYVNKQEAQGKVLDAIRAVLRGERYVSPLVTQRLLGRAAGGKRITGGVESLSNRELEIFELIGQGKSTRSIAEQLHLSVHTIETHRENIRIKLGVQSGTELLQHAVQWVLEGR
jgi:DNA-binding NarL/FixJ family response regulator